MKKGLLFLLGFYAGLSNAQFLSTPPTLDGSITAAEYGNYSGIGVNGWHIAWDNTYLYIGKTGGAASEPVILGFDFDPIVPVSGGSNSDGNLFLKSHFDHTTAAPFRVDMSVYWTADYIEYWERNGAGDWTQQIAAADILERVNSGSIRECRIRWADINGTGGARPASFNWFGYAINPAAIGTDFFYDVFPTDVNNPIGAQSLNTPFYFYQSVPNTSSSGTSNPMSNALISFETRGAYSYTNISNHPATLFDMTINPGSTNDLDIQQAVTLGGRLVIGTNGRFRSASGNHTVTFTGDGGGIVNNGTMFGEFSGQLLSLVFDGNSSLSGSGFIDARNFTINAGRTLDAGTSRLNSNSGTGTVTINGTLRTQRSQGLYDSEGTIRSANIPSANVTLGNSSTIEYYLNGDQTITTAQNYQNIILTGSGRKNVATGTFSLLSNGSLIVTAGVSFDADNGTVVNFNNRPVTLRSDVNGTARIADLTGVTVQNATNVTVERFIPAKSARKWSYVASPVTVSTIRAGWQDDVFITGPGTGGEPCGAGTGNGGANDQYNSNGFDATVNSTPSMFTYNATQVNGSRWVTVPNTNGTALTPGVGYRMNIRGPRANCANQLNSLTPDPPAAVTLSATGTVATGNVDVDIHASSPHQYTLIGNPYPCEISFESFRADNTNIANRFWTYSPDRPANTFTSWNAGSVSNAPTGYTNVEIIASGQSFFVETTSGTTVQFRESHKSTTVQNGNTMFRTNSWTERIRVAYHQGSERLDDILIRYGNDPAITAQQNEFDAISFNSGTYIASRKSNVRFAIQTRPEGYTNDTIALSVFATAAGNYHLSFSEYQQISAAFIELLDSYTNTTTDVRAQQVYHFTVNSDAASQGDNRFRLVLRNGQVLPVSRFQLTASRSGTQNRLSWYVAGEKDMDVYLVERSANGRDFKSVGSVAAHNTSTEITYQFTDQDAQEQTVFYRIAAREYSGRMQYSNVVRLQRNSAVSLQVYPNPVDNVMQIALHQRTDLQYRLRIADATGKEMLKAAGFIPANGVIRLPLNSLPPGMYVLHVFNGNEQLTQTFIKK